MANVIEDARKQRGELRVARNLAVRLGLFSEASNAMRLRVTLTLLILAIGAGAGVNAVL